MTNQILSSGTASKLERHTFNLPTVTKNQTRPCRACRAELGGFALNITINQEILNRILYIQSKDEESLVKQSFLMSLFTAMVKVAFTLICR